MPLLKRFSVFSLAVVLADMDKAVEIAHGVKGVTSVNNDMRLK